MAVTVTGFPGLSFALGLLVLFYAFTFVALAVLRIATGLSIQRISFSGLRRIAYTPRNGIKLEIRGIGLHLHRPTFAQPTWVSLVITELCVKLDLELLGAHDDQADPVEHFSRGPAPRVDAQSNLRRRHVLNNVAEKSSLKESERGSHDARPNTPPSRGGKHEKRPGQEKARSETWKRLTAIKERIKGIHRYLNWIRWIDVIAYKTSCNVVDIGTINIGILQLSLDTRPSTVDRTRLFQHTRKSADHHQAAEWKLVCRSFLFTPNGKESMEIIDFFTLNVHGKLHRRLEGLRDASISIKLGRVNIPWDDFVRSSHLVRRGTLPLMERRRNSHLSDLSNISEHSDDEWLGPTEDSGGADGAENDVLLAIADAKEFVSSILRGIHEVQVSVGFVGFSKRVSSVHPSPAGVYINVALKEFGADLYRLDPTTPAHSMYFARTDIAHEALLSAISISVGLDDGHKQMERLLYIPMGTTTIKTTLPAKALQFSTEQDTAERNTNVLFSNVVITSPSLDLDPNHLQLVLAMLENRQTRRPSSPTSSSSTTMQQRGHQFVTRILPKTSIKLSIHEPVIRIALPPVKAPTDDEFDFDLLISAPSSVSLDVDSFHSTDADMHYRLSSSFRIASHTLYYQTASRVRHDLMINDSIDFRAQVSAMPGLAIVSSLHISTLNIFVIRPEISNGLRQVIQKMRANVQPEKLKRPVTVHAPNWIRRIPSYLQHFELRGSDMTLEVAGLDPDVSNTSRGVAFHLESWTADYKVQPEVDSTSTTPIRRRGNSRSLSPDDTPLKPLPPSPRRHKYHQETDGRRLAIHFRQFEAFVVEKAHTWEQEPFIAIPRSEIAFSTAHDQQGAIFHINSHTRSIYLQYSLFRHYCIGVAVTRLRRTFDTSNGSAPSSSAPSTASSPASTSPVATTTHTLAAPTHLQSDSSRTTRDTTQPELVTIDVKANFIQLKATMPHDPRIMLHVQGLDFGKHRWSSPHVRANLMRMYVETPDVSGTWSRIVSIKAPRVDFREARRVWSGSTKSSGTASPEKPKGSGTSQDQSIDVVADAVRIGVPHRLVVHSLFDNFVNTAKTVAQLHHRFITESDEYILAKDPVGPKKVPRVTLRTHVLALEIEDGAFEFKLGAIFRAGMVEQKQRLARDEAFRIKVHKMSEARSARPSFRQQQPHHRRNASADSRATSRERAPAHAPQKRSASESDGSGERTMRYNKDGMCGFSDTMRTTVADAREKLDKLNAQSWKRRIDQTFRTQNSTVQEIHQLMWGLDEPAEEMPHDELILQIPKRAALASFLISDVHLVVDKPRFPMDELPDFMYRVGKGLPRDTQFGLLIPLHLHLDMGEARVQLRDYPLPLLHIPAIRPGQSPKLPSWSISTPLVIAEEFRDAASTRDFAITVVPADKMGDVDECAEDNAGREERLDAAGKDGEKKARSFAIDVRRTVTPTKMYSELTIDIHTANDTKFTWGTSYQPAIQDMMQVIEGFTKPQLDPSEKVGFWDKIRLSFHSRVSVAWKGDGDVHLMLRGSRDPYTVTGQGTGFVMVWRGDVRWNIWKEDDPRKFMTVDSGTYVLAVPDFNHYARQISPGSRGSGSSVASKDSTMQFKKVIMKLSGQIQWLAGLVFERNLPDGGRSFDFAPHYDVTLKNPRYITPRRDDEEPYDAFRGFRSNHIHMSIALSAPKSQDPAAAPSAEPSNSYNSIHLTPRFFTHFWSWWSLFSGVMTLPIRQGSLWPGVDKSNKKFGRHLASIKYSILLSPLFLSHIYKHKDAEDYQEEVVSSTGLKMRLDAFVLDVHQRREEFLSEVKGLNKTVRTTAMRINQALLDLVGADMRAVSSELKGTSAAEVTQASAEKLAAGAMGQTTPGSSARHHAIDLSKFTIPDNDFSWIDVDDFVEIDWTLPTDADPDTKILPLAYAPRFTYLRQTDHNHTIAGDQHRHSPFGYEPTHICVMGSQTDARRVQMDLIRQRLATVEDLLKDQDEAMGHQELLMIRSTDERPQHAQKLNNLQDHQSILARKREFLQSMLDDLQQRIAMGDERAVSDPVQVPPSIHTRNDIQAEADVDAAAICAEDNAVPDNQSDASSDHSGHHPPFEDASSHHSHDHSQESDSHPTDHVSDFSNRFVVHNAQIKWNNSLRNIILRYIHQNSQRRGFVYYTSRRAVKFILDIVDEQAKAKKRPPPATWTSGETVTSPGVDDDWNLQERIDQLLNDPQNVVEPDDPASADGKRNTAAEDKGGGDSTAVAKDYVAKNTYHVRLVAPQIQLQSEKNSKAAVLLTARGMRLKVVQIMDRDRVSDDVSGLVQRRFSVETDNLQFLVTNKHQFAAEDTDLHAGRPYGATSATSAWPPWVPLEVMFDFVGHTSGFTRVVQRTSASLRYDKYNTLRLKYNDDVSAKSSGPVDEAEESRMDHLWLDFPHLRAICDSTQYYAMYVIVLDLLIWAEPLEKIRNERLEKIMLASDFSDLRGAPEMIMMLQSRIRQLEEIKTHFHVHERSLDRQGWQDRIAMEQDLASCEDELFFMMKAITTSQRKPDDRSDTPQTAGVLQWDISASEIVWHLLRDADKPLAEIQLSDARYERIDYNDGSNRHAMQIHRIHGLNLLPHAIYPEMIGPYVESAAAHPDLDDTAMFAVEWYMLEAIAGIPVVEHFRVSLFPLKVQLEREAGTKLFEYVFPGNNPGEDGFSPLMIRNSLPDTDQDEADEDARTRARRISSAKAAFAQQQSHSGSNGHKPSLGHTSLESRLQPTTNLAPRRASTAKQRQGLGINLGESHRLKMFSHSNASGSRPRSAPARDVSAETTNGDTPSTSTTALVAPSNNSTDVRKSRFGIPRSSSPESFTKPSTSTTVSSTNTTNTNATSTATDNKTKSDDLTQMLSRASSYMTLAYVQIPSVVLCLSYKGKGNRNVEDVHNLVFRMPSLEYRNKTWSNLDLALALKKDVIRALISHTGAIIGNKLTHHKPGKHAQSRLRELASSSVLLGGHGNGSGNSSSNVDLASSMQSIHHGYGRKRSDTSLRTSRSFTASVSASAASLPGQYESSFASRGGNGHNGTPSPRFSDVTDDDISVNFDQRRRSGILLGRSDSIASSLSGVRPSLTSANPGASTGTVYPRKGILKGLGDRSGEKEKEKEKEKDSLISNPLSRSLTRHLTELTQKARGKDKDKDKEKEREKERTASAAVSLPSAASMMSAQSASAISPPGGTANAGGTSASVSAGAAAATSSIGSSSLHPPHSSHLSPARPSHHSTTRPTTPGGNTSGSTQKDGLLAVPSATGTPTASGSSGGAKDDGDEGRRQTVRHIGKRILHSLPGTTSP